MKNIYFTIALLAFGLANAQAPRGFYGGLGANQTMISSNDLQADPATGYRAGINFQMGYHENYNYQMEIMYNHSAVDFLTVDQNYNLAEKSRQNFNTVDLGLFFNFYVLKPEEDRFFIGPQVGINAAFAGKFEPKEERESEYYLPHLMTKLNLDDVPTVIMSGGLGLTGGYNDFRFDLRYHMGITNFLKNVQTNERDPENKSYTGPTLKGKMNMVSFTLSYNIFTWANK